MKSFRELLSFSVRCWQSLASFGVDCAEPSGGTCDIESEEVVEVDLPDGRFLLERYIPKSFTQVEFETDRNGMNIGMPYYSATSIQFDGEGYCDDYFVQGTMTLTLLEDDGIFKTAKDGSRYVEYAVSDVQAEFEPWQDERPDHFREIEDLKYQIDSLKNG